MGARRKAGHCLMLLLAAIILLPGAARGRPARFQILVDTNQLQPEEAAQGARFAADGVWSIPLNSPPGLDWARTLVALNARHWSVSEDNPGGTSQVDRVATAMHRMVDGAVFYNEDGMATPLSDPQIATDAAHVVPGLGAVGRRIILLTRSFGDGDPRQAQLQHALAQPNVAGATFEFAAGLVNPAWRLEAGCRYILSLHKKCYLLMPPRTGTADYVGDLKKAVIYFNAGGALDSPDVYLVLAAYARPNMVHYLSNCSTDRNSVEAAMAWLKAYRTDPLHSPP